MGRQTPRGLKFFFDASFPVTLSRALGQLDGENEYLHLFDSGLARDIADIDWIPQLHHQQIVVSGDGRILTNPYEQRVWIAAGLPGFFLNDTFPSKSLWEQSKFVIDRWEKLLGIASRCGRGETYRLPWAKGLRFDPWTPPPRNR